MSIKAGLVGLPNVGKSTLFNLLTHSNVPAANYPFCTIEPHVAVTEVPDSRLTKLSNIYKSAKIIPSYVHIVDIAGLVKGAASGEGLGNKFLSHIREVNLLLHVLRCFEDPNITHAGETIDPIADYEIIIEELMLKDLESITQRLEKIEKLLRGAANHPNIKKELESEKKILIQLKKHLNEGDYTTARSTLQNTQVNTIPLLSIKNFLIIANVSEEELDNHQYKQNPIYQSLIKKFGSAKVIPVCAKVEEELSRLDKKDAHSLMELIGLEERSVDIIIKKTYENLGLVTFFTCGPKEIHAWPIQQGTTVKQAAGEIHSDLERGFIRADVLNYNDLIEIGSEEKAKELGKIRTEGKDYIVSDGDIITVKFNV